MTETLYFPGLGWSFQLNRVAFSIAGRPIYWYGIIIGMAFIIASLYVIKRVREFGLDADRMIDVLLGTMVGGIIGARLYYVAFSWDTYRGDLMKIFNIRLGGLAFYGGVIGGLLAAFLMCRLRKVKLLPLADLFFPALLIGQSIGRWGNFVNIEAFGGNTTAPWGMTSTSITRYLEYQQEALAATGMMVDPSLPVHPTFFYESLWCLIGFVLLAFYTKHRRYDGELSLMYLFWYGLGRSWIEGLRADSLMAGSFRISQLLAILCVAASAALMILIRLRMKKNPESVRPLYVNSEEGQAILNGTFYPKKDKQAQSGDTSDGDDRDILESKEALDEDNDEDAEARSQDILETDEDDDEEEEERLEDDFSEDED